eukprot:TRINITY_DN36528_c0_g1_i1.p1 TRINITY_DN36528_c0_g1~~TRINITY_DN36528_c0_g1_i1.p1  ORF type:complete len:273 (+),score=46.38 TRINITY_DN36528_c0_g1_i1:157-975(+)
MCIRDRDYTMAVNLLASDARTPTLDPSYNNESYQFWKLERTPDFTGYSLGNECPMFGSVRIVAPGAKPTLPEIPTFYTWFKASKASLPAVGKIWDTEEDNKGIALNHVDDHVRWREPVKKIFGTLEFFSTSNNPRNYKVKLDGSNIDQAHGYSPVVKSMNMEVDGKGAFTPQNIELDPNFEATRPAYQFWRMYWLESVGGTGPPMMSKLKIKEWNPDPTAAPTTAPTPVSYTHLRAHETPEHLVCRLLLEKKKKNQQKNHLNCNISENYQSL